MKTLERPDLFNEGNQKPLYLVCGATLSHAKACNIKRHYSITRYIKTIIVKLLRRSEKIS